MKTSNKILIYDDLCPLCVWYTGLFVKYNLLETGNRVAFSSVSNNLLSLIDFDKAKDEIPLIDIKSKKVYYGFDALIEILGDSFPFIKQAGKLQPINWFFKKVYKFVSFNRKVVVAKKCGPGDIDCSPSFNIKYRLLLLMLSVIAGMLLLPTIHAAFQEWLPFYKNSYRQLFLSASLLAIITYSACCLLSFKKAIEYLGQHAMLALLLIIFLSPLLMIQKLPMLIVLPYLGFVSFVLIKEYVRRMRFVEKFSNQKAIIAINSISSLVFIASLFLK